MLNVPAARVMVTDDPAHRYSGHAGHLMTVNDSVIVDIVSSQYS